MDGVVKDIRVQNIFRYAVGSTLILGVAMGFDWTLAYLLPVLSLSFLVSGNPAPRFQEGLMFFLTVAFTSGMGVLMANIFLPFPVVHILLLCLILFYVFYSNHPFFTPLVKTWLLISVLVIPNIGLISGELAITIASSLTVNAGLAILIIWFIFLIFPKGCLTTA